MLFTPKNAPLVMSGCKTQTRRPVREGDELECGPGNLPCVINYRPSPTGGIIATVRYVVSQTYAVQPGRGKPAIGRIRITQIRRERLRSMSEHDARAEGIWKKRKPPRERFALVWDSIYGKRPGLRWADDPECWVLVFEVVR